MKIFETHAHYDRKQFDSDIKSVLAEIYALGADKVINPAIEYETNFTMREKLGKLIGLNGFPEIYFTVGIHPNRIENEAFRGEDEERLNTLYRLSDDERVVAIGETGLDYHTSRQYEKRQKLWFKRHIEMAREKKLPLVLHIREAHDDASEILKQYVFSQNAGVVHCFKGDENAAREYTEMGFSLGIGGSVTYDENKTLRRAVYKTPLERMVLETDSPFVKPLNWEGKNTSASLIEVANEVARIKDVSAESVFKITYENAMRIFQMQKRENLTCK